MGLGDGWYDPETQADRLWRWTNGLAQVQVTNPLTVPLALQVRLTAFAYGETRTLVARLDGAELTRAAVHPYPPQTLTVPLDLAPGEHWLTLASVEPAVAPPGDPRPLSLAFEQVAVTRR